MLIQFKKKSFMTKKGKKGKHVFAKDVNSVKIWLKRQKACKLKGSVAVRGHCGNRSLVLVSLTCFISPPPHTRTLQ